MWVAYGGQARLEKVWPAGRRGNKREAGHYSQFIQLHWLAEAVALFVTLLLEKRMKSLWLLCSCTNSHLGFGEMNQSQQRVPPSPKKCKKKRKKPKEEESYGGIMEGVSSGP